LLSKPVEGQGLKITDITKEEHFTNPDTVKDVIKKLLEKHGAMTKQEIVEKVKLRKKFDKKQLNVSENEFNDSLISSVSTLGRIFSQNDLSVDDIMASATENIYNVIMKRSDHGRNIHNVVTLSNNTQHRISVSVANNELILDLLTVSVKQWFLFQFKVQTGSGNQLIEVGNTSDFSAKFRVKRDKIARHTLIIASISENGNRNLILSNLFADGRQGCRQHYTFPEYLPQTSPASRRAYEQAERSFQRSRCRGNRDCGSCE
jgi:hypothetical protein